MAKFFKNALSDLVVLVVLAVICLWIFGPNLVVKYPKFAEILLHENVETLQDNPEAYSEAYFYALDDYYANNNVGKAYRSVMGNINAPYNYGYVTNDGAGSLYGQVYSCNKEEMDAFIQEVEDDYLNYYGKARKIAETSEELEANLRLALRIFANYTNKLVSSNGVRFEAFVDNPVPADSVEAPFPEIDQKIIDKMYLDDEEKANYNETTYYPCLKAGLVTEKPNKTFNKIGLRLKYNNIKVEQVTLLDNIYGSDYISEDYVIYGIVSADVKCIKCPEQFQSLEWMPADGQTNHVKFLVGYKDTFTLSYIDVLEYAPVEENI